MLKIGRRPGLSRPKTNLVSAAAILFSAMLCATHAFAAHGGSGFHGGGFHGGHGGHAVYAGGDHGYHGGRYYGGHYYEGWGDGGLYPGFGLGLALGASYPWGYYYPAYDGYYGTATPYSAYYANARPSDGYYGSAEPYAAAANWYYCANPSGYYPYVSQCYGAWQTVPAS